MADAQSTLLYALSTLTQTCAALTRYALLGKAGPRIFWPIPILCALLLGGCVTHTATRGDSDTTQTIYEVSEEEAFITILEIFAVEMPQQSVDDVVEGKYRGYNATARFWMDWTDHRVLVIAAKGIDKEGRGVGGYWYDIRSSGSRMIENPLRHSRIREAIQQKLGKRAVMVTNLQDRQYETDGEAYLGRKRDAQDVIAERNRKGLKPLGSNTRAAEIRRLKEAGPRQGFFEADQYAAVRRRLAEDSRLRWRSPTRSAGGCRARS